MSNSSETPSISMVSRWALSVLGVLGSIVIMMVVLGIAYFFSRPAQGVDASIVADRKKLLSDVQAKQADLYNNFSWVDQKKNIVRIPVSLAMEITAAKLDAATRNQPEVPARLSLAASPAGFTPPPPPAPVAAPVAPAAPAAGTAPAAPAAAPAQK